MNRVSQVPKNLILTFLASRYTAYGLNLLRGLLMAKFLGPQMFGIWGFLMLMQQYLSYTSLGLQYSITVELSTGLKMESDKQARFLGSVFSMTMLIVVGLVLLGFTIQSNEMHLFEKYDFHEYALALSMIVGTSHFQQLLTNIYRVYGKLIRIAVSELVSAVIPLSVLLLFRDSDLIMALLVSLVISGLLSVVVFLVRAPFKIVLWYELAYWKRLIAIGIPLLVYSASFYLITISARTVISIFYSAETMGYYSLANTITTATLLGLNAVSWVFFPDILSQTHSGIQDDVAIKVIHKVNDLYGTSVFLTVFGMIIGLPILFFFLPQYQPVASTLALLLISQAVLSISFGYNCLAIAREQHLKVAIIGVIAALVVTGLSLLVAFLKLNFTWIAVAVLVGAFVFTLMQAYIGSRLINHKRLEFNALSNILPWGTLLITLVLVIGVMLGYFATFGLLGIAAFVIMNRKQIGQIKKNLGSKFSTRAID